MNILTAKWRKYAAVAYLSWSNGFVYRTNFVMWRVRMVLQLLAVYMLWHAITAKNPTPFGLDQKMVFTYILGSSVLRSIVLSSKSIDAQTEIATGELSNYLVKPINYFGLWFARDAADKFLNCLFSIVEILCMYWLFRPPIAIQINWVVLGFFLMAVLGATVLYFFFSFIISMTTFWYSEANGWPQRFLVLTLLEFFVGALFPLNILPEKIIEVMTYLPTTYFLFFPLQIYLGQLDHYQMMKGFAVLLCWLAVFAFGTKKMWSKGVASYEAFGR